MRKGMKGKLAAMAILTASMWTCLYSVNNNPVDTVDDYKYVAPTPVENTDPFMMRSIPCSEFENKVEPCHVREKSGYVLVLSWHPKKIVKLSVCAVEDGGPNLPCIWGDYNSKKKKSDPNTRNIFWKGNLK